VLGAIERDLCQDYRNDYRILKALSDLAKSAIQSARQHPESERTVQLAGSADRVTPGHDPKQFEKFPTQGRIARIR